MWIAEFSQRAGLSTTTVRHYVREGLLVPQEGLAGGSRPYAVFTQADLRLVGAIRSGQSLGLSLKEIRQLIAERRSGGGRRTLLKTMISQREKLRLRAIELQSMLSFLDRKIEWLEAGANGAPPMHGSERAATGG